MRVLYQVHGDAFGVVDDGDDGTGDVVEVLIAPHYFPRIHSALAQAWLPVLGPKAAVEAANSVITVVSTLVVGETDDIAKAMHGAVVAARTLRQTHDQTRDVELVIEGMTAMVDVLLAAGFGS